MALKDIVFVKTNAGQVPAVVLAQRDVNGADSHTDDSATTVADLLLLGTDNAQRTLAKGSGVNQFVF